MSSSKKHPIGRQLRNLLASMKVGEHVKKEEIMQEIWGKSDYFVGRSLDVYMCKAKKFLKDERGMEFDSHINKRVLRTK